MPRRQSQPNPFQFASFRDGSAMSSYGGVSYSEASPGGTTNNYTQVFVDPHRMLDFVQQAMAAGMVQHGMNGSQLDFPIANSVGRGIDPYGSTTFGSSPRSASRSSNGSDSSGSSADGFGNRRSARRTGRRDPWAEHPYDSHIPAAASYYAWLQSMNRGSLRWTSAEERWRHDDR